jgi:hypothetical protein
VHPFDGGFATWGAIAEGVDLQIAEGWHGDRSAVHQIAFVALPDEHTVVGLQFCRTEAHRTYGVEVKGLHLNLPNDLFNRFCRQLCTASGEMTLHTPPDRECIISLESPWVSIEERIGVVGLYGHESLAIHREPGRRGGKFASLYVEQICLGCEMGVRPYDPGQVVIDCGWAVLSGLGAGPTEACTLASRALTVDHEDVRAVRVRGADRWYVVVANWGDHAVSVPTRALCGADTTGACTPAYDLIGRRQVSGQGELVLQRGHVCVLALGAA